MHVCVSACVYMCLCVCVRAYPCACMHAPPCVFVFTVAMCVQKRSTRCHTQLYKHPLDRKITKTSQDLFPVSRFSPLPPLLQTHFSFLHTVKCTFAGTVILLFGPVVPLLSKCKLTTAALLCVRPAAEVDMGDSKTPSDGKERRRNKLYPWGRDKHLLFHEGLG